MSTTWERCLDRLEVDLTSEQFNTWIRPLHAVEDGSILRLLAPNHFVRDWVNKHFLDSIRKIIRRCESAVMNVTVHVGSRDSSPHIDDGTVETTVKASVADFYHDRRRVTGLRSEFTFENFVEGKSNQMARAASMQVASDPCGTDNNPLFIYGGVGLGKTHLMHAIGNRMLEENLNANVVYLHSEQFVTEMVTLRFSTTESTSSRSAIGQRMRFSSTISSSLPERSALRKNFSIHSTDYLKENGSWY